MARQPGSQPFGPPAHRNLPLLRLGEGLGRGSRGSPNLLHRRALGGVRPAALAGAPGGVSRAETVSGGAVRCVKGCFAVGVLSVFAVCFDPCTSVAQTFGGTPKNRPPEGIPPKVFGASRRKPFVGLWPKLKEINKKIRNVHTNSTKTLPPKKSGVYGSERHGLSALLLCIYQSSWPSYICIV